MHDGGNLSLSCSCPCPKLDGRRPKRESGEDRKGNAYSTRYRPVMHKQGWTENSLLSCSKHVWSAQFSVNFCFSLQTHTHTHKSWVLEGKNSLLWGMPGKVQHDFFFYCRWPSCDMIFHHLVTGTSISGGCKKATMKNVLVNKEEVSLKKETCNAESWGTKYLT